MGSIEHCTAVLQWGRTRSLRLPTAWCPAPLHGTTHHEGQYRFVMEPEDIDPVSAGNPGAAGA